MATTRRDPIVVVVVVVAAAAAAAAATIYLCHNAYEALEHETRTPLHISHVLDTRYQTISTSKHIPYY